MNQSIIDNEITYKAVRSSGSGGQHVNKVSSKITLFFNVLKSNGLTADEKETLIKNLNSKITQEGLLILSADESRSQFRNKAIASERLIKLLSKNIVKPKKRKATKPTKGSKVRKAEAKIKHSQKKSLRQKPKED